MIKGTSQIGISVVDGTAPRRDPGDRGAWDTAFVDAVCDPPETFTFGGMVAHVLTWSAHRRYVTIGALCRLGVDVVSGDPIEWERRAAR